MNSLIVYKNDKVMLPMFWCAAELNVLLEVMSLPLLLADKVTVISSSNHTHSHLVRIKRVPWTCEVRQKLLASQRTVVAGSDLNTKEPSHLLMFMHLSFWINPPSIYFCSRTTCPDIVVWYVLIQRNRVRKRQEVATFCVRVRCPVGIASYWTCKPQPQL